MKIKYQDVCDIIFSLYLYGQSTKRIHYSTDSNHAHELCDDIQDVIYDFTDTLAESYFGHFGKPAIRQLSVNQKIQEVDDLGKICKLCLEAVEPLRTEFDKDPALSGIVSAIDDFKQTMQQKGFLATFDRVSNIKV